MPGNASELISEFSDNRFCVGRKGALTARVHHLNNNRLRNDATEHKSVISRVDFPFMEW